MSGTPVKWDESDCGKQEKHTSCFHNRYDDDVQPLLSCVIYNSIRHSMSWRSCHMIIHVWLSYLPTNIHRYQISPTSEYIPNEQISSLAVTVVEHSLALWGCKFKFNYTHNTWKRIYLIPANRGFCWNLMITAWARAQTVILMEFSWKSGTKPCSIWQLAWNIHRKILFYKFHDMLRSILPVLGPIFFLFLVELLIFVVPFWL